MPNSLALTVLTNTHSQIIGFGDCRFCSLELQHSLLQLQPELSTECCLVASEQFLQIFQRLLKKLLAAETSTQQRIFTRYKCVKNESCRIFIQIYHLSICSPKEYMHIANYIYAQLLKPVQQRTLTLHEILEDINQYEEYLCKFLTDSQTTCVAAKASSQ